MAFGANFFAMTGLMVYLSLIGKSELAADIGIVQASTMALFYAFSANARSLILNKKSLISAKDILAIRYRLILPLSVAAAFLSFYISNVAWIFAALLILRRGGEWLADIYLSESEIDKKYHHAKGYLFLQCIALLLVFVSIHISNYYFYVSLLLWSITPFISCTKYLVKKTSIRLFNDINLAKFLPHLGSTAAIGIGVYVFRLVLLSLVDKPVAGDLFSAFAIGGFIASVFTQTIGPSLVAQDMSTNKLSILKYFHLFSVSFVFIGIALIGISWNQYDVLLFMGKNGWFFGAIGFSLIGGALMIYAQHIRLQILQHYANSEVYGPDVLINLLFIASVPFLYFIFGVQVLPILFLLSATINYIIYRFYYVRISGNLESFIPKNSNANLIYIISGLIIIPIFFQINSCLHSSCIFNDKSMYYDTEGLLYNLPIPLSIFACLFGFVVFNDYKKSRTTMTVVLMLFVLMVISTVVTTNGELNYQLSKMIFMMQFIMPILALVLGQLIYKDMADLKLIAKSFLYVIVMLVPVHLLFTWFNGSLILVSYLYLFSFYQHLQYGPIIVVSVYIFSLFILSEDPKYRKHLFILLPLVGLYAVASASRLSIALYLFGIGVFTCYQWKSEIKNITFISFAISIICMSSYLVYTLNNSQLYQQKLHVIITDNTVNTVNTVNLDTPQAPSRSFYWKYYLNGIFDNNKTALMGHKERPDRTKYPSAHNYYLDLAYNFGLIALFPILILIAYTLKLIIRNHRHIISTPSILGITLVTLFMIIIDNSLKVGFRQPYPGIYSFFIWGLLLGVLNNVKIHAQFHANINNRKYLVNKN